MTMKFIKQIEIANKTGLSKGFISRILSEKNTSKPSYKAAKKLGAATNTDPILWLENSPAEIKAAIKKGAQQ